MLTQTSELWSNELIKLFFFFVWTCQNATTENNYNVKEVWAMNYTGAGIVVAVVDEGLNTNHPELRENYVSVSKKLRFSL